jgi:predicted ester cyclase
MPVTTLTVPATAAPGLTLEQMKEFVKNHFERFVNQKESAIAYHSFSDDFLDHDEPTGVEVGPEAAKQMMEAAYVKWPDLHVSVEDILAEGDKVMVRNVWHATEIASGQKIEFHGFVLWRFANGKIVERWATITPPKPVAAPLGGKQA